MIIIIIIIIVVLVARTAGFAVYKNTHFYVYGVVWQTGGESREAPASSRTHNSRIRNSFLASENLQLCRRTEFNLPAISKSSQENGKFSKLRTMRFLILLLFFFWSAEKRFCLSRRTIRAVRNNPPWAEINNVYINCRAHLLKGYPSLRFRELARKYSLG